MANNVYTVVSIEASKEVGLIQESTVNKIKSALPNAEQIFQEKMAQAFWHLNTLDMVNHQENFQMEIFQNGPKKQDF